MFCTAHLLLNRVGVSLEAFGGGGFAPALYLICPFLQHESVHMFLKYLVYRSAIVVLVML